MNKVIQSGLLSLILCSASQVTLAATAGAYIGGGAGFGQLDSTHEDIRDNNVFGGRVFVGYNFNRYLGLETSYSALAKTRYYNANHSRVYGEYSLNAWSLVGKIYLPLSDRSPFSLYGLFGGSQVEGKFDLGYHARYIATLSDSAFLPTAGAGLSYDLNHHLTTSIEYALTGAKESSDNNLGIPRSSLVSLNLAYRF